MDASVGHTCLSDPAATVLVLMLRKPHALIHLSGGCLRPSIKRRRALTSGLNRKEPCPAVARQAPAVAPIAEIPHPAVQPTNVNNRCIGSGRFWRRGGLEPSALRFFDSVGHAPA